MFIQEFCMMLHLHDVLKSCTHIIPHFDFISHVLFWIHHGELLLNMNIYGCIIWAFYRTWHSWHSIWHCQHSPCLPCRRRQTGVPLQKGESLMTLPLQTATAKEPEPIKTDHFPLPARHCSLSPMKCFSFSPTIWTVFPPSEMFFSLPSSTCSLWVAWFPSPIWHAGSPLPHMTLSICLLPQNWPQTLMAPFLESVTGSNGPSSLILATESDGPPSL